jgi:hypothetical protein
VAPIAFQWPAITILVTDQQKFYGTRAKPI